MEWRRSCSTCIQRAVPLLYLLRTRSTEPSSRTRSAEGRPAGRQRCMLCCGAAAFHAATPWNTACHNLRVVPWDGTKLQHKTLQNNVPHTGAVEPCTPALWSHAGFHFRRSVTEPALPRVSVTERSSTEPRRPSATEQPRRRKVSGAIPCAHDATWLIACTTQNRTRDTTRRQPRRIRHGSCCSAYHITHEQYTMPHGTRHNTT